LADDVGIVRDSRFYCQSAQCGLVKAGEIDKNPELELLEPR
jgi:hypothetical protein